MEITGPGGHLLIFPLAENVICYNQTSDCSGGFDPGQARTFLNCCDNDGISFQLGDGTCSTCQFSFH